MTTYASFDYPRTIYQLPSPNTINGLRKKREARKRCEVYYTSEPRPISGPHPGGMFYLGSDFEPGRGTRFADEVISLGHKGWFCDEDQDQTIRGIVISLPHDRFLVGWSMGESMASEYDGQLYQDEDDAAQAADSLAEAAAGKEREYQQEETDRLQAEEAEEKRLEIAQADNAEEHY